MIVVWDGCKNGPGGAMLLAPQSSMTELPRVAPRVYGDTMRQVRALRVLFGDRWFTTADLAKKAGLLNDAAASAISSLYRTGDIRRERQRVMRGRIGPERQRYQFVVKQ